MATTPLTQSIVTAGLVGEMPIPTDATTSRVIVNNEACRVVAFVMDAGQELTEHASPKAVTVHLTAGDLLFTVAGEPHELTAGDVVFLAPGARHALVARTPSRFLLVMVDATP